MMQKKPKPVKRVNEPDAFKKTFPEIKENGDALTGLASIRLETGYSMGQLFITFAPEFQGQPAILQVNHPNRLPKWDEIVWIRYQICPEIEDMACILPPISEYINYSHGRMKYTMTLEDISIRRKLHKKVMNG